MIEPIDTLEPIDTIETLDTIEPASEGVSQQKIDIIFETGEAEIVYTYDRWWFHYEGPLAIGNYPLMVENFLI